MAFPATDQTAFTQNNQPSRIFKSKKEFCSSLLGHLPRETGLHREENVLENEQFPWSSIRFTSYTSSKDYTLVCRQESQVLTQGMQGVGALIDILRTRWFSLRLLIHKAGAQRTINQGFYFKQSLCTVMLT